MFIVTFLKSPCFLQLKSKSLEYLHKNTQFLFYLQLAKYLGEDVSHFIHNREAENLNYYTRKKQPCGICKLFFHFCRSRSKFLAKSGCIWFI